jgi:hypothetical protein
MKHSKSRDHKIVLTAFLATLLLVMVIPLQTRINSVNIASAEPETTLTVEPASIIDPNLTPGEPFTVDINVADVIDLFSWQVAMSWTPGLIELTSVTYGDFLPPGTKFSAPPNINNAEGWVGFGETTRRRWKRMAGDSGVSGCRHGRNRAEHN